MAATSTAPDPSSAAAAADDPRRVRWGDGTAFVGTPFIEVVPASATDGRVVVLAAAMPPGLRVDPHVHEDEDQIVVVVEGTVHCRVGADERVVEAGGVVFMPRGVEHELHNVGPDQARTLELYTPGGFEQVLRSGGRAPGVAG